MFNMGPMELAVIVIVALLVIGPKRLPEIGKTLGKTMREFRKVQDDLKSSIDFGLDDEPLVPSFDKPPAKDVTTSMRRRGRSVVEYDDDDEGDDDADVASDAPAEDMSADAPTDGAPKPGDPDEASTSG